VTVDPWEVRQTKHSPTARVLERFAHALNVDGGATTVVPSGVEERRPIRVMLLAGADLLESMNVPNLWSVPDMHVILGQHGCVVAERTGTDLWDVVLGHDILYEHRAHIHTVKQVVQNDVSSTKIRLMLKRGMSVKYLLPDTVIEYIHKHGLYGTPSVAALSSSAPAPEDAPDACMNH
ncbi:hypothetical protein THASP1DRAFT_18308, partial [Thamnocephalis sphaerospora]